MGAEAGRTSPRKKGIERDAQSPTERLPILAPQPYLQTLMTATPASSATSSSFTRTKRSTSPIKSLMDLQLSDIGMRYENFSLLQTPRDALGDDAYRLFEDLRAVEAGEALVHPDLRDEFERHVGGRRKWLDLVCAGEDEDLHVLPQPEELDFALDIVRRSASCEKDQDGEAEWNCEVHSCVLRQAVKSSASVGHKNITAARIMPRHCPYVSQRRLEAKMVDFALYIRSDSLGDGVVRLLAKEYPDSPELRSINHTQSAPLRLNPLAVSIETKTPDSGYQEARAQLALWASAHLTRLSELVALTGRSDPSELPTLPLICVDGSRWFLYFLRRRQESDTLFGEHFLGGTESLIGIFKLIASLRRITTWIESSFMPWFLREALMAPVIP